MSFAMDLNKRMPSSASGIKRLPISSIVPGITDFLVVGIIIAKQSPRMIKKLDNGTRGVWNLTIRDSPCDIINVSCWGPNDTLSGFDSEFHIGDVVQIINAKVSMEKSAEQDAKFRPSVTSPFQLAMSNQSTIQRHDSEDCIEFLPLLKYTTKPPSDFLTLADIHTSGVSMRGECVDLLVVVRSVFPIKCITTKDRRELVCRDVVVMDQTSSGLPLQLWNSDIANRAEKWRPRETVLFLADVRVEWNAYKRGMVASDGSRTIITEDPNTTEASLLRNYARTAPIRPTAILDHLANSIPDPNSIRQVMTIQQLLDRASAGSQDNSGGDDSQFTALLYCLVTHLDLDGCFRVTVTKCSQCQLQIDDGGCINLDCPIGSGAEKAICETSFDMRVSLTDHTGFLENCRLTGSAAERVLKCSVDKFLSMSLDNKTNLKWTLLLERCAARVLVLRPSSDRPRPLVSLLACSIADSVEVTAFIPAY